MRVDASREIEPGGRLAAMAAPRLAQIAAMLHAQPRARQEPPSNPQAGQRKRPFRSALARLAASALLLSWTGATWAAPAHPRVVSINLCTDQLVLSLADPDQILGLSPYARDKARSWLAAEAERYPLLSGTAEEVLVLKPDLVLAGRYTKRATRALLKAEQVRVEEFDATSSIEDVKSQILRAGALLGQEERAREKVAAIDAALARAHAAAARVPLSVLPLQRRGWVSGRATLMTSLLSAVGLRNAGAALSGRGRSVTLESVVALKPDLLLLSAAPRAEDQGSALLSHPALRDLYPPEKRLILPEILTVCGGPMLADALDRLVGKVAARP